MTAESHRSEADLIAGLPEVRQAPADSGTLVAIIVRPDRDLRELPAACEVTPEAGIPGDRWSRHCTRQLPDGRLNPDTQITIMNTRFLAQIAGGRDRWPLAGDNLLVELDVSERNLPAGQRLRIGSAVLEITGHPHLGCAKFSKRFGPDSLKFVNSEEGRRLRLRGVHAQVVQPGRIEVGDRITKL